MGYPIIINYEKFSTYELIERHGKKKMDSPKAIVKEAWKIFGTVLTEQEVTYIGDNFEELEKGFKLKEVKKC